MKPRRGKDSHKNSSWFLCRCECGNQVEVKGINLKAGRVKSCGCLQIEKSMTHGMTKTATYTSWKCMKARCYNPTHDSYPNYGGQGITVCDRWLNSFEAFLEDMGERPEGMTLDRYLDKDGNYCKSNCRWATNHEQANNRENNNMITYQGKTQSISQWAKELRIKRATLVSRLRSGWTVNEAFTIAPSYSNKIKKAAQIMKHDSVFDLSCECGLCDPDMAFKCKGCLLESVPYCLGQDDDYFDYCTPCWYQLSSNLVTVVVR